MPERTQTRRMVDVITNAGKENAMIGLKPRFCPDVKLVYFIYGMVVGAVLTLVIAYVGCR